MKYHITTFGCQMNEKDSLTIAALLDDCGHSEAAGLDQADLIIVNTCCVRQSAENKIAGFIGSLKKYKTEDPAKIIIVYGCMSQKDGAAEKLQKTARHVDMVIGTFAIAKLPRYIKEIKENRQLIVDIAQDYGKTHPSHLAMANIKRPSAYRAQVSIILGCNNYCSYCIVPYVRGREKSRAPEEIEAEITALTKDGCKEVELLGQNVNSYGHDLEDSWDFARLLTRINAIDGLERVRFMTSHPRDFTPELLDTILTLPKVCHHFHLPVQSGNDRILKQMNRGYTTAYYLQLLSDIRKACPDAAISSDLIVGFPGESDDDFQVTLDFVRECRFDVAYTFIYSPRTGTKAAELPGQVPAEIKKQRLRQLMDVQNPISLEHNQKLIGQILPVMTEGLSKNNSALFSGRTPGNKIVVFPAQDAVSGSVIPVKIVGAKTWNLFGEPV